MARIDAITRDSHRAETMSLHDAITITAAVEFVSALIAESDQLRDMFREEFGMVASDKIHTLAGSVR